MSEKENKETYSDLSELLCIALKAIKDSSYRDESKMKFFQMLNKAQVPVKWYGGGNKMMPLGHVFKKEFEITGVTLSDAYSSYIVRKDTEESKIFDEEGMMPDDDKVNHPAHYMSFYKDGIECIDAMKAAFGEEAVAHFCACNAFKYLWRHSSKGKMVDIDKALWYLNKYKELGKIDMGE